MRNGVPLKTTANVDFLNSSQLYKVIDLQEFVSTGQFSKKHCLLLHEYSADLSEILSLGWGAIIITDNQSERPNIARIPQITKLELPHAISTGDVILVSQNRIDILYRRKSNSNLLFVTENCDHKCIMCSQPPKEIEDSWRIDECHQLLDLIDQDVQVLGISGGEPTLLGTDFLELLKHAKEALPFTMLHILTNGCAFEEYDYVAKVSQISHQNILWGIPLYGTTPQQHDYHTQTIGSFNKTMHGLYNLGHARERIELRIVLTLPIAQNIVSIADFIQRNLPFVETVALMGIEPIGFAKANYETVWCELITYQDNILESTRRLLSSGINTVLYNIPLCHLPDELHNLAAQSISDWKNSYRDECNECIKIDQCCGFFKSHRQRFGEQRIEPIQFKRSTTNAF